MSEEEVKAAEEEVDPENADEDEEIDLNPPKRKRPQKGFFATVRQSSLWP